MSEKKCCVESCENSHLFNSTILHQFPNPEKDIERFNYWLKVIGGHILSMDPIRVFARRRVCHLHFEEKFHTWSNRLTTNAIPTLLLHEHDENVPLLQSQQIINETTLNRSIEPSHGMGNSMVLNPDSHRAPLSSSSFNEVQGKRTQISNKEETQRLNKEELSSKKQVLLGDHGIQSSKKKMKHFKVYEQKVVALGNKIKKIQKSKIKLISKLKKASKIIQNPSFKKKLKNFSSPAYTFTMLQFREAKKKTLGRRFTKEEKILALSMYKQGPRAYRWIRNFFVMPAPATISRMLRNASLKPGLNENLFSQLQEKVNRMTQNEKLCILLFDEMSLSPHFDYNRRSDKISGFVDNGRNSQPLIADHVLVFMIRGLHKNYKQPLAYTFCHQTTKTMSLVEQLREIILKLKEIGLTVVSTVCDQGATNVSAINYLINKTKQEYIKMGKELTKAVFEIDGHEVIPLYDPPHLIKGIRNNLLNKDLKYTMNGTEKIAKWEHIIKLYNEDPSYQGIRLMPKLSEKHVVPAKISKMKVKCATQVFSQTVAANMGFLAQHKIIPEESKNTADILLFFDKLFDSLNGSYNKYQKKTGKPLLAPVTPNSPHWKVWEEAKIILRSMKFEKNGKSSIVPSIKNWIMTIDNIELIVKKLSKNNGLTSVWMRHFNQDPLENFFGSVRSHGYRNNSPSCAGFQTAFASLLINTINNDHSGGSNCEKDDCSVFQSLRKIFFDKSETSSRSIEIDFNDLNIDFIDLNEKNKNCKIKAQIDYVTGYVLRNLKKKVFGNCTNCKVDLFGEENSFNYREYFQNKICLTYPNINLTKCFSAIQDVVDHILRTKIDSHDLKKYIKLILSVVIDYNFINCTTHKNDLVNQLEDISINLFIYTWCKNINKLLNGTRSDYDDSNRLQKLAFDYCNKRKK